MKPVTRNIEGKLVTRAGTLDMRHERRPKVENYGQAYAVFVVEEHCGDSRPWHVIRIENDTNVRSLISRHTQQRAAERHAERHRSKQPDRKPSRKLKHLLGER